MAPKALLYRVSLTGIKGFTRLYALNPSTNLYTFHKQLRSDLEFPQDQLILFKALREDGSVEGRYGLFDLGCGAVDEISLAKTVAAGVVSFVYFYDVTARKSVNITFEGESSDYSVPADSPRLVETKGPIPIEFENGYVAYEDLPDDQKHIHRGTTSIFGGGGLDDDIDLDDEDEEDEDDEDDDSSDEDGKEIFDENEGI